MIFFHRTPFCWVSSFGQSVFAIVVFGAYVLVSNSLRVYYFIWICSIKRYYLQPGNFVRFHVLPKGFSGVLIVSEDLEQTWIETHESIYFHLSITIFWASFHLYFTQTDIDINSLLHTQYIHFCVSAARLSHSLLILLSPNCFSKLKSRRAHIPFNSAECFLFDSTIITIYLIVACTFFHNQWVFCSCWCTVPSIFRVSHTFQIKAKHEKREKYFPILHEVPCDNYYYCLLKANNHNII